jgi:hypothetical protein
LAQAGNLSRSHPGVLGGNDQHYVEPAAAIGWLRQVATAVSMADNGICPEGLCRGCVRGRLRGRQAAVPEAKLGGGARALVSRWRRAVGNLAVRLPRASSNNNTGSREMTALDASHAQRTANTASNAGIQLRAATRSHPALASHLLSAFITLCTQYLGPMQQVRMAA